MKRILLIFALLASAFGQAPQRDQYGPLSQGDTRNIPNIAGSQAVSFEYVFSATPGAVSITIQGCMRGKDGKPGQVGTCDAAVDTYAVAANSIRSPTFTKVYDTFLITVGTLTGATVTINTTVVVSKVGTSSGGAGGGVASVTGSAPITSSGGANPDIACATCNTSSAALTTNAVVLGAANNQTEKTTTSFTTNGTSTLTVGVAASGNGVLALSGNTSGAATLTAPAVAGTVTNAVVASNQLNVPGVGLITQAPAAAQTGIFNNASSNIILESAGIPWITGTTTQVQLGTAIRLTSAGPCAANGTAANPSVVTCGASIAGNFSCATAASTGTCQVNTTAVSATSEIFITQRSDTTMGTTLGVTCNTTLSSVLPEITAVTAATSFTINLGTIVTNPECFSYFIMN